MIIANSLVTRTIRRRRSTSPLLHGRAVCIGNAARLVSASRGSGKGWQLRPRSGLDASRQAQARRFSPPSLRADDTAGER